MNLFKKGLLFLGLIFLIGTQSVIASETDGTIDTTHKYAEVTESVGGLINFGTTNGNVHVTDAGLTGYAWGENIGWINLNPGNAGVNNDAEGTLTGYAWGEKAGWVNFNPTNGGVSISDDGEFSGWAWSEYYGWISFNCATEGTCGGDTYKVVTDWRPESVRDGDDDDDDPPCTSNCGGGGPTTDYCPNISGNQSSVPAGMSIDGSGNCVNDPPPPLDVCPNVPGNQTVMPAGYTVDAFGNCVPADTDVCPNIAGNQTSVPTGWSINGSGDCVADEADVCPNIPGTQSTVPNGSTIDSNGNCVAIGTDICPNLGGNQTSVPSGWTIDGVGNCVRIELEVPEVPEDDPPGEEGGEDPIAKIIDGIVGALGGKAQDYKNKITKIYKNPRVNLSAKAASGAGLVVAVGAGLTSILMASGSITELLMLPLRLWSLLLSLLGLRKRHRPWGTVYDSITKQPLDPAYVVLQDAQGNEISTSITDLDGRYGFLASQGTYTMLANKTNYIFPSKKLAGRTADELYSNLYFGEPLNISQQGEVISRNIPLDPEKFDWNEFAKGGGKYMKFYSRRDKWILRIGDWFFRIGFLISVAALLIAPEPYNYGIGALYIVLLILRRFGLRGRTSGAVVDKVTGNPLSFAIVRIISPIMNNEIAHKVTDIYGRYYALIPPATYTVRIEKKNPDESYSLIAEIPGINAKKGIINQTFKV